VEEIVMDPLARSGAGASKTSQPATVRRRKQRHRREQTAGL
jgi:hypothetical protein